MPTEIVFAAPIYDDDDDGVMAFFALNILKSKKRYAWAYYNISIYDYKK